MKETSVENTSTTLEQFEIGPARKLGKLKIDDLIESLKSHNIPIRVGTKNEERMLLIGPDAEYVLSIKTSPSGKIKTAFVLIRYENPIIKDTIIDWMDKADVLIAEEFYPMVNRLSPTTLKSIQRRWNLDLSNIPISPWRFGKNLLAFMASIDLSNAIGKQLQTKPHKKMDKDEFIECDGFGASGVMDTDVYRWVGEDGAVLFVTMYCAPASTMLELYHVPQDAPVKINIKNMPDKS
jgi:hypothetical protein